MILTAFNNLKYEIMNIKNDLYSKLSNSKIKINNNKNLINMDLFLSFLKIKLNRNRDNLGNNNGWTEHVNTENNLVIGGGVYNGIEYLDCIQYGVKLQNKYNNYVNPFYLFDLMNNDGKLFFVNYYKEDIEKEIELKKQNISFYRKKLDDAIIDIDNFYNEYYDLMLYATDTK